MHRSCGNILLWFVFGGCAVSYGGLSLWYNPLVVSSLLLLLQLLASNRSCGGCYCSRARCQAQIQRLGSDEMEFHEALEPVDSSETLGQRGGVCL